jgi:hypothetical protein
MIHLKLEVQDEPLDRRLQRAIELEHATIPTYLYSLYSLNASNPAIQGIILSVVQEEMLHFGLACNVLNAIDGAPCIDKPDFIPTFPGHLPGGVDSGLIVHLKRFSLDHVHNTFMAIEEPETPLRFPDCPAVASDEELAATAISRTAPAEPNVTIGAYYTKIMNDIIAGGQSLFKGNPARQVAGPFGLFKVHDVPSAVKAITTIIDQGEGTSKSPQDGDGEVAHYYRFEEIWRGRQLLPVPGTTCYCFDAQHPVPFDPKGVLPVIDNPSAARYPPNTQAHYLNDNFNYAYTSLLKVLHLTFNGQPNRLEASIGLMHSLRELAMEMMTTPFNTEGNAGPSFEYQPVNP